MADFFEALSPVELDALKRAIAAQKETLGRIDIAHEHQLQRLRYEAQLASRQFGQVDPDNRLVAAELERRWEEALRALKQAEDTVTQHQQRVERPLQLSDELKVAFTNIGEHLPQLWEQLRREHQKALLRCLIDKVVVHRCQRDTLQLRIVWRGGDTTSQKIPIPVNSFAELSGSKEMERIILDHSQKGKSDEAIARKPKASVSAANIFDRAWTPFAAMPEGIAFDRENYPIKTWNLSGSTPVASTSHSRIPHRTSDCKSD